MITAKTVGIIFKKLRKPFDLYSADNPIRLGGQGREIQKDESLFCRKT